MSKTSETAIITGGTRGIGRATAKKLVERGLRVVLTARTAESGEAVVRAVRGEVPGAEIAAMELDLASFASVRAFAERFLATGAPISVLVNNAGVMETGPEPLHTADGFELCIGTNHLGHYLLTRLLIEPIRRAEAARVINVSSRLHMRTARFGPAATLDLGNLRGEKGGDGASFYRTSKLMNVLFTYELERRLASTRAHANAFCPGFVPETIAEHRAGLSRFFFRQVLARMPFATSLELSSTRLADLATDPALAAKGGLFYADGEPIRSSEVSYDEGLACELWAKSAELTGLPDAL